MSSPRPSSLRVIVVSTEPPDPYGNAGGRWYYVLAKGLSQGGHQVRWLSAYKDSQSVSRAQAYLAGQDGLDLVFYPYPKVSWVRGKLRTLRRPYSHFISEDLRSSLGDTIRSGYDILHLEPTWAGWLGISVPRTVLSVHSLACVDLGGAASLLPGLVRSSAMMRLTERYIISRSPTIRVLSRRDSQVVRELNPVARVALIPFALDHRLYRFSADEPRTATIGLIGSMAWHPTRSAAVRLLKSVWPRVKERVQGLKLLVAGWGARQALAKYVEKPDVAILDNLPDAEPFFRQLSLLIFPLRRGSGTKVKVLEAMAYGVPVVTTHEGIEGIEAVDGIHAAIADDDDVLATRVADLMGNREARQAMRLAARDLIVERHSPASVLPQIRSLYESVLYSSDSNA